MHIYDARTLDIRTLAEAFSGPDCSYFDDPKLLPWWIVVVRDRDSDALSRTNFDAALRELSPSEPNPDPACGDPVGIIRARHWAVGWVEYLIVDPEDANARQTALELLSRLYDYPILDEDALSALEFEEHIDWIEVAGIELPPDSDPWSNLDDWQAWCEEANAGFDADPEPDIITEGDIARLDKQLSLT